MARWRVTTPMYSRVEVLLGIISLVAGLIVLTILFPERWWTDRRFSIPREWVFSREVMLVGLDEQYAERHGYGPVSTGYLAAVVRAALPFKPTAIALDFRISEKDSGAAGMDSLAAAIREANAGGILVVIPSLLATWQGNTTVVRRAPPELAGAVVGGYVGWAMPGGGEGKLFEPRDFPPATRLTSGCHALAFPVAAVAAHRRALVSPAGECFGLGTVSDTALPRILLRSGVPRGRTAPVPIYFAGPVRRTDSIGFYSSEEFIQDAATRSVPDPYRGRLILVAALYPTPDGADAVTTPFGTERGGLVHLYAIDTLLRDRVLQDGGWPLTLGLEVLMFCAIFAAWKWYGVRSWLFVLVLLPGYVFLGFVLFWGYDFLLPLSWPVWAGLLGMALGFIVYGDPDARQPAADNTAPAVDNTAPAVDNTAPAVEDTAPVLGHAPAPMADGAATAAKTAAPAPPVQPPAANPPPGNLLPVDRLSVDSTAEEDLTPIHSPAVDAALVEPLAGVEPTPAAPVRKRRVPGTMIITLFLSVLVFLVRWRRP